MKKIITFFLLFSLTFAFVSCEGDEDVYDWKGNWNDPKDPNYKPEGYNPIKGMWKSNSTDVGLYFTDDFKVCEIYFYSDGTHKIDVYKDLYIINNEALRYVTYPETNRYILEGNTLKITANLFEDKGWKTYTRFTPQK